jgi:hypothetical protein
MEDKIRPAFASSSVALSLLFKDINLACEESERLGKVEALNQLMTWARDFQSQGLKYIPVSELIRMSSAYDIPITIQEFPDSRKRTREDWQ